MGNANNKTTHEYGPISECEDNPLEQIRKEQITALLKRKYDAIKSIVLCQDMCIYPILDDDCEDGYRIIFEPFILFGHFRFTIGYYYTPHEALTAYHATIRRFIGETQNKHILEKHSKTTNRFTIETHVQEIKEFWDNF